PAWWPATSFGGPVAVGRELTARLVARGHAVSVLTTALVDLHAAPARRTREASDGGVRVRYLATPLRYRWMGITPTLPLELLRARRPDVPYVFEPLGMFRPRLRKVALKRLLDSTVYRGIAQGAAAVVVSSELERDDVIAGGVDRERIHVRGNGFPAPYDVEPADRAELGIPEGAPVVLYVG